MIIPQSAVSETATDLRPFTVARLKIELEKALQSYEKCLMQTEPGPDDISMALQRRTQHACDETLAALARISDGTYGVCESCDGLISEERLKATPYTKRCATCARMGGRET
jgi:RNA polymerase-binding transcription factor DksA